MAGEVEDISDENYDAVIQSPAALIAYGIASCEPCTAYDPILVAIAGKFPSLRVGKAKMHVPGRCREIKKQHTFETYPTTHLFSHGQRLCSREGKIEESELAELVQQHFPSLV